MKRVSLILALLLLLTLPRFALGEEPTPTEPPEAQTAPTPVPSLSPSLQKPTAPNMTNAVTFDVELPLKRRLEQHILDKWIDECEGFGAGQTLAFSWETAPNVRQLCIQWEKLPGDTVIRFYNADGLLLGEDVFLARYDTVTAVPEGAVRAVLVAGSEGMSLARLALFGEGILPSPFFDWQDTPDTLDYLVIATHPDDDVLFMGSIVPIYGAERGYVGTVAFATSPNRLRISEALAGVWTSGSVYYPIFLGYPDISYQYWSTHGQYFLQGDVTRSIVRMLRQRHPLVVFTQDIGGEYGHWQHIVVSKSVADAVKCAADPAYDPESAGLYGTWQVQKLYVHLWPENPLTLDIDTPLAAFGGKSAFRVAEAAFRMHMSQNGGRHEVHDKYSRYSIAHFGMAYGVVEPGADAFDNIDETLFSFYVPPTPSPTPEPTPTPAPTLTPTPTPTPTPEPTPTPTPAPTGEPTPTPTEPPECTEAPVPDAKPAPLWPWLLLGGAALLTGGVILLLRRKKNT